MPPLKFFIVNIFTKRNTPVPEKIPGFCHQHSWKYQSNLGYTFHQCAIQRERLNAITEP